MSQSVELKYEVRAGGPIDIDQDISQHVTRLLGRLSTDPRVRESARQEGIDIEGYDELMLGLAQATEKQVQGVPLIQVQPAGAGIEPGTVLVLVTIVPPILEHFVAPVAVHIATSIWDNFILPELKSYFVTFSDRTKADQ